MLKILDHLFSFVFLIVIKILGRQISRIVLDDAVKILHHLFLFVSLIGLKIMVLFSSC